MSDHVCYFNACRTCEQAERDRLKASSSTSHEDCPQVKSLRAELEKKDNEIMLLKSPLYCPKCGTCGEEGCCTYDCNTEVKKDRDAQAKEAEFWKGQTKKLVKALEYSCEHSMVTCDGTCENDIQREALAAHEAAISVRQGVEQAKKREFVQGPEEDFTKYVDEKERKP